MFAVVYLFKTRKKKEKVFIDSWKDLTTLIYENEGSLGSRLHKQKDGHYIAYAQWPNKEQWKQSGSNLPESASEVRQRMRSSCESVETLHELEMIEDLTKENPYQSHL
jgi:heme-degrading monooxygenase HmoA